MNGSQIFDDFINEKKLLKAKIVLPSQNPKLSEKIYLTDKKGGKYELYEFNKKIFGLPMDIFIGFRRR